MKLAMSGALLKRLVERALKSVARRTTIPILKHIRIEVLPNGRVIVTGTDLDNWISIEAASDSAKVEQAGTTCIPGTLFGNVLKKLPDGEISIDASDGRQAVIKAGTAQFKIHILPAADFPEEKGLQSASVGFLIPADHLTQIEKLVSFAMSDEETRYYLNGVYLHLVDGDVVAVATNGHTLSRAVLKNADDADPLPAFRPPIIHRDTLKLFATIAEAAIGTDGVTVTVDEARICFEAGDLRVVSKLIDGEFPDYPRVIPANNQLICTIEREALVAAVERVRTISAERGRVIGLTLSDGELRLQVKASDGDGEDVVPCDWNGDEGFQIGANGKYLATILGTFTGDEITLAFGTPGDAMLITDAQDPSRIVILMPMRV
ncbi:DNA polymerase III subunit beta [Antarcticirhabdus aurantiaca]|uniref:DNA polymerase III subunit beta n=1 Tax=Antarcticirhabdus aurantiaca TaxID=2606717 RepID=A0ACD4NR31_9HYPH|nr:DNA polymerase III subunit beta [Jeongeuplla avenae]